MRWRALTNMKTWRGKERLFSLASDVLCLVQGEEGRGVYLLGAGSGLGSCYDCQHFQAVEWDWSLGRVWSKSVALIHR